MRGLGQTSNSELEARGTSLVCPTRINPIIGPFGSCLPHNSVARMPARGPIRRRSAPGHDSFHRASASPRCHAPFCSPVRRPRPGPLTAILVQPRAPPEGENCLPGGAFQAILEWGCRASGGRQPGCVDTTPRVASLVSGPCERELISEGGYRMRNRVLAAGLALLVLGSGSASQTQDRLPLIPLATSEPFQEHLGGARISAALVVAARLGQFEVPFSVDQLRTYLPDHGVSHGLCSRVTTRDGRYWAENDYDPTMIGTGLSRIAFPTSYKDELAKYDRNDVLMRVLAGPCSDDASAELLPEIGTGPRILTLFLNVGNVRAAARLLDEAGNEIATATCDKPEGELAVSFTRICRFNLPDTIHGRHLVSLQRRALTGKRTESELGIWLP